jgi:hypothetical protein
MVAMTLLALGLGGVALQIVSPDQFEYENAQQSRSTKKVADARAIRGRRWRHSSAASAHRKLWRFGPPTRRQAGLACASQPAPCRTGSSSS